MKNVTIENLLKKCTGCSACMNVCPVAAIELKMNKYGFYNPVISSNCIGCEKCLNVCQIEKQNKSGEPFAVYGCKNINNQIRVDSSSGGVFISICKKLSELYGDDILFVGAEWTKELTVEHRMENISSINVFQGSKYVQSYMGYVFRQIEEGLCDNKYVLFSGTGCQCFGLKQYLNYKNISLDKLFILDIVCHGVPSVKLWKDYIFSLENSVDDQIVSYSFRDKSVSWHGINPKVETCEKKVINDKVLLDSYGKLFGNMALNACCHSCKFANINRVGDITLGDFWGIEKPYVGFDDGKGVSLCLINSEKGKHVFDWIGEDLEYISIEDDSYLQPNLLHPTKSNIREKNFWNDYLKRGYKYVADKYTVHSDFYKRLSRMYKIIRNR